MKKAGDSSEEERSDGERAYDEEYYQDSDGVKCRRDCPRSDSDPENDGSVSGEEIDIRGYSKEELIALPRSGTRDECGFTMGNQYDQDSDR